MTADVYEVHDVRPRHKVGVMLQDVEGGHQTSWFRSSRSERLKTFACATSGYARDEPALAIGWAYVDIVQDGPDPFCIVGCD